MNLATIKELLIFALPIILGQLGQMLIGVADVYIAGRHSVDYLAAVGLATGVMAPVFVVGLGFHFGLSPLISERRGEGKSVDELLFSSIVYSSLISILFILLCWAHIPFVHLLGFDPRLVPLIKDYLFYFSFSFGGAYLFQILREFLQGKEIVILSNVISILTVLFNLVFCSILVFGLGPIPPMGLKGLAIGSVVARSLAALVLLFYCRKYLKSLYIDWKFLKSLLLFCIPISLSILIEVSAFSMATILVGRIGVNEAAAHNIVLNLASITFMVPLAISTAISVKIAYSYGTKSYSDVLRFTKAGLFLSLVFMGCTGLLFTFFPRFFGTLFTGSEEVLVIVVRLLFAVALFQVFDGTQVTIGGALRGVGRPMLQTIVMVICYWMIGIPLGWYLANVKGLTAFGIWLGLASALSLAAILLTVILYRVYQTIKKDFALNK